MSENRSRRTEKGTAVVEAAATIFMFFIVLFGILEAGRFMSVQQTLTNAAREGARLAVAPYPGTSTLPSTAEIEQTVQTFLNAGAVQVSTVEVERPVVTPTGDVFTRVTVTSPYRVVTLSMFTNLEIDLSGNAMMRHETSP